MAMATTMAMYAPDLYIWRVSCTMATLCGSSWNSLTTLSRADVSMAPIFRTLHCWNSASCSAQIRLSATRALAAANPLGRRHGARPSCPGPSSWLAIQRERKTQCVFFDPPFVHTLIIDMDAEKIVAHDQRPSTCLVPFH